MKRRLSDKACIRALRLKEMDPQNGLWLGKCPRCGFFMILAPEGDKGLCMGCDEFLSMAEIAERVRERKRSGKRRMRYVSEKFISGLRLTISEKRKDSPEETQPADI